MKTCKRCNQSYATTDWPRYSRNGRLMIYCSPCNAALDIHRAEVEAAKARGYSDLGHTPEYKREQRRRAAERAGRVFVTADERALTAALRAVDRAISRDCVRAARAMRRTFGQQSNREAVNAAFRERYWKRPEYERARTASYKSRNPERKRAWDTLRFQRMRETSDGSATETALAELKARVHRCHYCAKDMDPREKQTDHVVPLCAGGAHSLSNIVIACASCNGRKAKLEFGQWVERQEGEQVAA